MTYKNPQYLQIDNLQLHRLNELCDSFDDRLHSGDCPRIEELLERVPADEQAAVFVELLAIDLEFHTSSGFRPEQADYHTRFPAFRSQIEDGFCLIAEKALPNDDAGQQMSDIGAHVMPERVGDFRIIREVGRGGMGVVYEAQQESLDRSVAIKVLARNVLMDGRQRERFDREARAAGRLHHSNIVPVFGVGCEDGVDFLVMQLIRGKALDAVISRLRELPTDKLSSRPDRGVSLQDVFGEQEDHPRSSVSSERVASAAQPAGVETVSLKSSDTFQIDRTNSDESTGQSVRSMQYWRELAEVIRAAADALHYAHEQGILHRDIKPGNLLLDTKGRIWITDFGLAKAENSEDLTHTGQLLGTLKYMPPEAFNGESSHSSDIYALGLTLYELTALRPAFQAENRSQLIRHVMDKAPASVRSINAAIPRDLETIVNKAIERDPQNRYATSADFAEDLRRFCSDEPILARRTSPLELAWRWARRHKLVAALSCTLGLVLLITTTVLSIYANRVTGLNSELNENAVLLTTARNSADSRANETAAIAREAQSSLVGMKVASAFGHIKDGKTHRALVEMQAAWDSDTFGSREDRTHQMRIGALLEKYPDIVGLAMPSGQKSRPQYQPWNDLLMVAGDEVAEIWRPSSCELLWRVEHGSTKEAELCSTGRRLLTRNGDDCLVWNIRSGEIANTFKHDSDVAQAVFSPDGSTIATSCADGRIRFWDAADGSVSITKIDCEDKNPVYLEFIDNRRIIASNGAGHVRIWSVVTGEALTDSLVHRPSYRSFPAFTIADERLATVDGKKWSIWDLNNGALLAGFQHSSAIESVHFCEHGGDAVVNSSAKNESWHYDFGKSLTKPIVSTLTNPRQSNKVALSSDGDLAATRSTGGTTLVWNLRTQKIIAELANVRWLEFVDDRRLMVTGENATRIVSLRHRHLSPAIEKASNIHRSLKDWAVGETWSIVSSTGEREFRLDGNLARLLDRNGKEIWRLIPNPTVAGKLAARFSPDGSRLLIVDDDTYSVRNAVTGIRLGKSFEVPDKTAMHQSADGARVTLLFESEEAAVWDVESARYIIDGRPDTSPTANDDDSTSSIRDLLTNVRDCVIAPNGKYIVVTNDGSETYHVIDVDTLEERFQIDRHHGVPATIQFTKDSTRFITANSDTTSRVWDATSGTQIGPHLLHPTYARAATISDDGGYAATIDSHDDIRTWDVLTGEQLGVPIEATEFDEDLTAFTNNLDRLITVPTNGDVLQHRLPRLQLSREWSRLLIELVTNLYDTGAGRSETLTAQHMENRQQYIAAWQRWRKSLKTTPHVPKTGTSENLLLGLADDIEGNAVFGTWTCDGRVLTSDELRFSRIELPVEPTGSYRISLDFTRRSGNDHIGLHLPTCDGRVLFVIDSNPPKGLVTLDGIDGRTDHRSGQNLGQLAPLNQERSLEVSVQQNGPIVNITAMLDEKEIYQWNGASRRLALHRSLDVYHPERPTVQTHKSRFEIRNVEVTELIQTP